MLLCEGLSAPIYHHLLACLQYAWFDKVFTYFPSRSLYMRSKTRQGESENIFFAKYQHKKQAHETWLMKVILICFHFMLFGTFSNPKLTNFYIFPMLRFGDGNVRVFLVSGCFLCMFHNFWLLLFKSGAFVNIVSDYENCRIRMIRICPGGWNLLSKSEERKFEEIARNKKQMNESTMWGK